MSDMHDIHAQGQRRVLACQEAAVGLVGGRGQLSWRGEPMPAGLYPLLARPAGGRQAPGSRRPGYVPCSTPNLGINAPLA